MKIQIELEIGPETALVEKALEEFEQLLMLHPDKTKTDPVIMQSVNLRGRIFNEIVRASKNRPSYYRCGICDHYHSVNWSGDCRENGNRFTEDDLIAKHGSFWEEVPMPT